MKITKSFIRIAMILLFTAMNFMAVNNSTAQQTLGDKLKAMTPQQRADYQTGLMKSKLHLDTEEIVKVKAVNLKYALKAEPIIKSDDGRFTKLKKFKALLEQKDVELKGLFNALQYKLYKDYEDEMREKMKEKTGK